VILVTGATGCLGSALTKYLVERGERVAIFRRENDPQLPNLAPYAGEVEHRLGDVLDDEAVRSALRGVRQVYHLAGVAVPLSSLREAMFKVNVVGTDVVLTAAKLCGVERVVFTSSASTIGLPDEGEVANEDYVFNGGAFRFPYMHSKRQAEAIALRHAAKGLDVVVVNPTAVMAPAGDDRRGSWAASIIALKQGRLRFCPSGGLGITTRRDMVDGHVKAMARGKSGQRYILNSTNLTYRDLIGLISSVVGVKPPRFQIPDSVLHAAGLFNSTIDLFRRDSLSCSLLSRDNTVLLTKKMYYDQSKACRELNLSQTSLRDSIEEVYSAWLTFREKSSKRPRLQT